VNGVEIEVVGGSSRSRAWGLPKRPGRGGRASSAALQLTHLAIVERLGDVESVEEDGGIGFGGVAVLVADDALELARRIPSASVSVGFS